MRGAMVADGINDGIVASIARGNDRRAVFQALQEAAKLGINVPTAETNRSTAYEALEALTSFPKGLRGQAGKRRLISDVFDPRIGRVEHRAGEGIAQRRQLD